MVRRPFTVENEGGLHVSQATMLAKVAEYCTSKIEIYYDYNIINAKSMLNILSASIGKGARIEIRCTGPDEKTDLEVMTNAMNELNQ